MRRPKLDPPQRCLTQPGIQNEHRPRMGLSDHLEHVLFPSKQAFHTTYSSSLFLRFAAFPLITRLTSSSGSSGPVRSIEQTFYFHFIGQLRVTIGRQKHGNPEESEHSHRLCPVSTGVCVRQCVRSVDGYRGVCMVSIPCVLFESLCIFTQDVSAHTGLGLPYVNTPHPPSCLFCCL